MKRYFYALLVLATLSISATALTAQGDAAMRPSPLVVVEGQIEDANVTLQYSSPAVKGRNIWGGLVPYDKIWRTGANEATTIELDEDIVIGGKTLQAGKYGVFTIPGEEEWIWVFNEVWDQWGAFKYDDTKDVLRITAKPESSPIFHERMTFAIEENVLSFRWENLSLSLN